MSVLSQLLTRISLCGALGVIAGACSATLDFTECHEDADCASFFDDNKPMYCDLAVNVCKVRDGGCDANSQCAGLGEAFICTNSPTTRECASTEAEGCSAPIYPGGKPTDDVVFMGVMLPKTGADEALGLAMEKGVLAAAEDFAAGGELQSGREVALVVCDTKSDVAAAAAAARHLGDTLTVPVFVGPVDDLEFVKVVDDVTFASGIQAFTMGPMVTADMSELDSGGLVFSAMAGAAYQGPAMGARIAADFAAEPDADAIVLLSEDSYGFALYGAVATQMTMGPNKIPEVPGSQFIASYKGLDDPTRGARAKLDDALEGAFAQPSMLVLLGRTEVGDIVDHYRSKGIALPQKIYVPHRAMASVAALADPSLAGVVVAIAPELDTPQVDKLRARLGEPALPGEVALAYDATMASLIAMAAVKAGDPVVGVPVANAVTKLSDEAGVPVDFSEAPASFVAAAVSAFKTGKTVDLTGFSGPLDFDARGEVCASIAAYTLDATGAKFVKTAIYTPDCPATTGTWANVP